MENSQFDNFIPQLKRYKFNLKTTLTSLKLKLQMRYNLNALCVDDQIYTDVQDAEHDLNSVSREIEAYSTLGLAEESVSIKDFLSVGEHNTLRAVEASEEGLPE